jgi:hypothetical protein
MPFITVDAQSANALSVQELLHFAGAAQFGNENVRRGAIAVDNGAPHKIADGGSVARFPDQLGHRLDVEAEIFTPHEYRVVAAKFAVVHRIHYRESHHEFHYTLQRGGPVPVDASCAAGIHRTDAYAALESGGKMLEIALQCGVIKKSGTWSSPGAHARKQRY